MTIGSINRYIFTLNAVHESPGGHISEVDLRKRIKQELEQNKSFEMDKKTLRRIVDNLVNAGLIKSK